MVIKTAGRMKCPTGLVRGRALVRSPAHDRPRTVNNIGVYSPVFAASGARTLTTYLVVFLASSAWRPQRTGAVRGTAPPPSAQSTLRFCRTRTATPAGRQDPAVS